MKQQFYIKGLHCASCVYTTEKALKTIPGVSDAVVNLANGNATISSKKEIADSQISNIIKNSGYEAIFDDKKIGGKGREMRTLQLKTTISLVLAFLIMFAVKNIYLQFILATIVQFWGGYEFYLATIPSLKKFRANMDTLVVVGTSVAYFYSVWIIFFGMSLMPYFETSTAIIALVLLGRFLEAKAKRGTGEAIKKLIGLQPKEATVIVKDDDERVINNQISKYYK
jgi:P-type Cu+ transporter